MTLGQYPFLEALRPCQRVLIAGAGGGFDILAGLPLAEFLWKEKKEVFLASLSFSDLKQAQAKSVGDHILEVTPDSQGNSSYFPELYLSQWLASCGRQVPIYCYPAAGPPLLRENFRELWRKFHLDTLILVDGGTDILMRGDEPALGTPLEDMCSLAAAATLELPRKFVMCLGFGIDAFHEVCHAYVLEAIQDLTAAGQYWGAFSLLPQQAEFQALVQALDFIQARMPGQESIVLSSVVSAGQGRFGDHHATSRTQGSQLFINPLMAMYFCFGLEGLAGRCLHLEYLQEKYSRWDVHRGLCNFLTTVQPRPWQKIPL